MTVVQTCSIKRQPLFISTHHMSLYDIKTGLSHNIKYTVNHVSNYRMKISSAHAHSETIRGGHFKLFKTSIGCTRNWTFSTVSQAWIQASDGSWRKGATRQVPAIAGVPPAVWIVYKILPIQKMHWARKEPWPVKYWGPALIWPQLGMSSIMSNKSCTSTKWLISIVVINEGIV